MRQLLHYYPREYDQYTPPVPLSDLQAGGRYAVRVMLRHSVSVKGNQRKSVILLEISEGNDRLQLTWFNMPFLRSTLKKGGTYIFRGKVQKKSGRLVMEQPEIFTLGAYQEMISHLQPVYALTKGLTSKMISRAVRQVLEERVLEPEYLPEEIRQEYGLCEINFALEQIHFPTDADMLRQARKRLVFDEFFFFLLTMRRLKERTESIPNAFPIRAVWTTEEVIENLPFPLTGAQMRVWNEIEQDLKSSTRMARLVQGDVGSGKTVLAFLAMILAAENGYQSALMVPTEVLARQHYESLCELLEKSGKQEYCPMLLTGSSTAREKREVYRALEDGSCRMVIGTHALIQEKVKYRNLALVITDEQHRFGVRQRTALAEKGEPPNVLVMSATPIPRTLAIILYGDLSISVIDELPARRLPIRNCVVNTSYRPNAYRFIQKQVEQGRQAYVICPMVEESEGMDAENVLDYTEHLRQVLPEEITIRYLHGKMKSAEKNEIMDQFAGNEIQVLVSTTVVEVGVNVPNATVMMVENAERFGLAQLHQLRGRVGRGEYQSYCIFVQGNSDKETMKRLEILNHSNDGFLIAREDLKLRGSGDLLGTRQSGDMEFAIADIFRDSEELVKASQAAGEILAEDPFLEQEKHRRLRAALDEFAALETQEIGI